LRAGIEVGWGASLSVKAMIHVEELLFGDDLKIAICFDNLAANEGVIISY